MAPPIFSSVRSKSRPALLGSFRDDSSLVALRYEKTAQAEPPRTLPPRASNTTLRPVPSDLQLSSTSTPVSSPRTPISPNITGASPADAARNNIHSSDNSNSNSSSSVVVVVSPSRANSRALHSPARPLTPPLEIHPALRDSSPLVTSYSDIPETPATSLTRTTTTRTRSSLFSSADTWKRDSGAPTTSSATIRGDDWDDCYDYCADGPHYDPLYDKLRECAADFFVTCSPVPPPSVTQSSYDKASVYSTDNHHPHHHTAHDRLSDARQEASSPTTTSASFTPVAVTPSPGEASPIQTEAPPRKLVKSLSSHTRLGLSSGGGLRKRSSTNKSSTSTSTTDSSTSSISAASSALSALAAVMSVKISIPGDSIPRQGSASAAVEGGGAVTGAIAASSPATPTKKSPNLSPASAPANSVTTGAGSSSSPVDPDFSPLFIAIPDDRLLDDDFMTNFTFSNRGSVMFGGRRAVPHSAMTQQSSSLSTDTVPTPTQGQVAPSDDAPSQKAVEATTPEVTLTPPTIAASSAAPTQEARPASANPAASKIRSEENNSNASMGETTVDRTSQATTATPSIRVMSVDAEKDSQKVRSLYESGDAINWEDGNRLSPLGEQTEPVQEQSPEEMENDAVPELHPPTWASHRSTSSLSTQPESTVRREYELAGGIEDWEDVDGADVDRYGFITPRRPESRVGTPTELKSAQYAPRRRNVLVKRDMSGLSSSELNGRSPSRKVSARSLNTQNSERSVRSRRSTRSAIRQASNYLPHNRNRRWMDEAGEMLTLAPGLQDIMEDAHVEKISEAIKKKETERSEKWRKMAKVVKKGKDGEGMEFEFDVKNPKLIERTWKGIPDRWRASAWYSFMATSARNRKGSPTEEQIKADFHRFQEMGSPDDVQIDLDVPRTINRHIMFRRRYRGGQRLLFRVLHAVSLYFPDVGYVQGMASLAATLLCYFDEERCFVMLVRMWQMRGLEQLYQPGFEGLMTALKDLETQWLGGKEVAKKLADLCIDSTAYGTRWYLTLFNLSIPFQAQLRVWDVFILLGDLPECPLTSHTSKAGDNRIQGIDIVHATSAALINALGEVLLDSDFENAMKALTSWIPIKDEDLLMKVTKAEWKAHQSRKKA